MNPSRLPTEQHRRDLLDLDLRPTAEQVGLMVSDQQEAVAAVRQAAPAVAAAVDAIVARLAGGDGRMIYVGAGTAGRLGVLDASEVPPTFDSDRVIAVMAGGDTALNEAREAAEDDAAAARRDLDERGVGPADVVVGVAASGRTPYTLSAVAAARERGALTVGVSCNPRAALSDHVDHAIEVATGPELMAGSTRLKAGTAQKIVLNTLSTLVMVQLGKTFGNLMVNVRSTNEKLRHRAHRMVVDATGVGAAEAQEALDAAAGAPKVAIVALLSRVDPAEAERRLAAADGRIREALEAAP
ncbi:MAG: N-acetylmuramic acid 6-phosphate etherase [Actinomycetota bacterium]